ncbi:MAG: methyltransferase, partial [Calditrichaceae bacterium]
DMPGALTIAKKDRARFKTSGLRKILRLFAATVIKPPLSIYLRSPHSYHYKDIHLRIAPGVFHPGFFFSTRFLINYLENIELKNKTLLEPGAGSGLISIFAANRGAKVTATDISQTAVNNLKENAVKNRVNINILRSDLFEQIPEEQYDIIVINPPYYPGIPKNEAAYAWYCGEDFEYFQKLFAGIKPYIHPDSVVLMSLSDDVEIGKIASIAAGNGYRLTLAAEKRVWWERQFVFMISEMG